MVAALAAAKHGVEVLVLEKGAEPAGNTVRSTGLIPAAGTRFQREAGIFDDTPELMAKRRPTVVSGISSLWRRYTVRKGQTRLPPVEPMNRWQNRIQNWKGYSAMVFLILDMIVIPRAVVLRRDAPRPGKQRPWAMPHYTTKE